MARLIEDIIVKLGLQGFEGLDKIRSSFRDLSKVTNMSERDINAARNSLFEFAKTAGNTEAVNKGLASALQGLRTQVDTCGRAYTQLTNDLNRLNEAARGSTDTLEKQRQALLNSASAGRQNADSLQRQIDGLKQLQRETRPGSSAFIQLGKDIDTVTVKLGKLKSEAQGFNLALNQQAGATPSVLNNQIALLQRGLQNVRYDAEKFVDTLRQIQLLQITQSGRAGRAGVIASFEAYKGREYLGGFADPSRLRTMPDTTAALNQELAELSERLVNTTRGSATYTDVAIRMADVQRQLRTDVMGTSEAFRQLSIAEAGAERRAGKIAGIQEYYSTQGPLAPGVGGYRDPATGAMIARGAYTPGRIRVEESAYPRPIGPQPFPEAATAAQRQIEAAQKDINSIYERAYVQRAELQSKYAQIHVDKLLEGLDLEGKVRQRAFTQELADFDKQLAARESRRRRRLTGMQLAQGVGAALSGGIFGGPEGLIGGLGGLAVGGVGGAFAGAAFGAQLAGLRQAGAAAATYAAEVRRLQLALQGIVSSFDDYKAALAAVDSASRTFNVPVLEATQQFTKLSAAVLGSGGTIKDAENTFKGLTASVLATGGSVEDINGALVAAAQVFSKGKVTAEELRGQIGERLAGAFALFAESSGKSSKGLDAALKSGEVTIADFVKFTEFSLAKYGRTAQIIAASPEQAGARLDNALKKLQKNIGDSLGPAGAAFQDFATRTVNALDKVITKLVDLKLIQPGAGYYESLVLGGKMSIDDLEKRLLEAGSRLRQAQEKNKGIGGFVTDLATPFQSNVGDIFKAQKEVNTLEEALIRVRRIEKETNKDRKQRAADTAAELDKARKEAAEKAARERQAAAAEQQRLANTLLDQQLRAADRVFQHQIELDRQRYELQKRLDDMQAQNRILRETGSARDIVSNFEELQRGLRDIEERRITAAQNVRLAQQAQQSAAVRATFEGQGAARLTGATGFIAKTGSTGDSTGPHLDARWTNGRRITAQDVDRYLTVNGRSPSSFGITSPYGPRQLFGRSFHAGIDFGTPSGSKIGLKSGASLLRDLGFTGAGGYAVEIDTPEGKMRLLHLQAGSAKLPTGAAAQQNRAIKAGGGAIIEGLDVTQAQAQQKLINDSAAKERAALFEQFTLKATASLREQNATMRDNNELQTLRNRLTLEGVSPERIDLEERLLGIRQEQNKTQSAYTQLIKENPTREAELTAALTTQNEQFAERARLLRESADAAETFNKSMRTRQDNRIGLGLREGAEQYIQSIGTMREATAQLAQTGIKGIEDAIFSLVTTGTANFREFAASILRDTARMIIQQLILRSVMQIIGAIGGGGGSAIAKSFEMPNAAFIPSGGFKFNAMGAAYAANGIVPYAMGGVVKRPTMFAFANGGAGRLGLMGEAGPEAIMPLRRLPSGRLGVESAGGGTTNVVVNVDASGSQVQGDAGRGEQLGRAVSAAVQAELIKQKRPGGLLS